MLGRFVCSLTVSLMAAEPPGQGPQWTQMDLASSWLQEIIVWGHCVVIIATKAVSGKAHPEPGGLQRGAERLLESPLVEVKAGLAEGSSCRDAQKVASVRLRLAEQSVDRHDAVGTGGCCQPEGEHAGRGGCR